MFVHSCNYTLVVLSNYCSWLQDCSLNSCSCSHLLHTVSCCLIVSVQRPGSEIAVYGTVTCESDIPKKCFSVTFCADDRKSMDYFNCKSCKINCEFVLMDVCKWWHWESAAVMMVFHSYSSEVIDSNVHVTFSEVMPLQYDSIEMYVLLRLPMRMNGMPLYFAVVLFYVCCPQGSPNRTRPNFTMCSELSHIWKLTSKIWDSSKTCGPKIF